VIDQSPEASTTVDTGTTVTVTVSAGPGAVTVPDVSGQSEAQARQTLEQAGLKSGDNTTEDSATVGAGDVIRTDPAAGQSVEKGATVSLVLSSGQMELPDLVGTPYQDARAELLKRGFQVVIVREPSEKPVDTVTAQDPGPGKVDQGTEVTLTVADPMPSPTTSPTTTETTTTPPPTDTAPPTVLPTP
jgi:serine/threonine-protein kinase